jgi:hypothetical protein
MVTVVRPEGEEVKVRASDTSSRDKSAYVHVCH